MGIGISSIGNYNPYLKSASGIYPKQAAGQILEKPSTAKIADQETDFFAKLYPANLQEINNYHFYERSGKMTGVNLGQLFDRRG